MATNRAAVRRSVSMNVKDELLGVVSAVGGNAVTSTDLAHVDNGTLVGATIHFITGALAGLSYVIKSHVQDPALANGSVTPYKTLSPLPSIGDQFEVHRAEYWTADQYNEAIRRSFNHARGHWMEDAEDTSITLSASTDEYALPAGWRTVSQLYTRADSSDFWTLRDLKFWDVVRGTRVLKVSRYILGAGNQVRLVGQKDATPPASDTDTIYLPEEFLVAKATAHILRMKPGGPMTDVDSRDRWALAWDAEANRELPTVQPIPDARIVDVPW